MGEGGVRRATEREQVELPLLEHLKAMGWRHIHGPDLQEAEGRGFGDVFLEKRLRAAILRASRAAGGETARVPEAAVSGAVEQLRRAAAKAGPSTSLEAVNDDVTAYLLSGAQEKGAGGRDIAVPFVDWSAEAVEGRREEVLARNDFLVVDQLRVVSGRNSVVLDLVLFVNGIPVAIVECKSPHRTKPLAEAIHDLRTYSGRPLDTPGSRERRRTPGVPQFFAPVQLTVAADGTRAVLGTISSAEEHYAHWRSLAPDYESPEELRRELREWGLIGAEEAPTLQHQLAAMVLKPGNLLNIIRHYVFLMPLKEKRSRRSGPRPAAKAGTTPQGPRVVKVVCRHQQYRATERIVRKLRTGRSLLSPGAERDERGGVVWHTQGAGKSFTMQFIARRLHLHPDPGLNRFTIVAVTDRRDLERQLKASIRLSRSEVWEAKSQRDLQGMLERAGRGDSRKVIFATVQKFLGDLAPSAGSGEGRDTRDGEESSLAQEQEQARARVAAGEAPEEVADPTPDPAVLRAASRIFPECSDSAQVLVLVDEAHRSHTSVLHACLRQALPNAARLGFTGTPLMQGRLTDTGRIFGLEPNRGPQGRPGFLDEYRMDEAERDGVVVPVRYEGRATTAEVRAGREMDEGFEDLIEPLDEEQKERVREKYGQLTGRDVAESVPMIRAKAADMLAHYVTGPLTRGFKAQVAAVSRQAVVLYRAALQDARAELLAGVREFERSGRRAGLRGRDPDSYTPEELLLLRAWQYQQVLRRLDFVPVISAGTSSKDPYWTDWTNETRQRDHIESFLEPFPELPPDNPWVIEQPSEPDPVPAGRVGGMNPWSNLLADEPGQGRGEGGQSEAPIAFLIVKSMLLTGFDAPIEQVLYLDRPIRNAELLQAIARVNRPAPEKAEGRVVDYYGVLNNLGEALAAYRGQPPVLASVRSMTDEIPGMGRAAEEVEDFLAGLGIRPDDLDTRGGLGRAMLAMDDSGTRAGFDRRLGEFVDAVERVLPHQAALEWIGDVRRWSVLQMRVRRHYRDEPGGGFALRGYGRGVRALIADHLQVKEVEQGVAPVSLLAPDFDAAVGRLPVREAAAEQVQALRYHLEERMKEDERTEFRRISEELDRVLKEFEGHWEEIKKHVGPLVERARRMERADPAVADLTPTGQRLYTLLVDKLEDDPRFELPDTGTMRRLVQILHTEIVDRVMVGSYGGEADHVAELASHLMYRMRKAGLRSVDNSSVPLARLAQFLAGNVTQHVEDFRREGRRQ